MIHSKLSWIPALALLAILILVGCKNPSSNSTSEPKNTFEPKPVILEHQDVNTLEIGKKAPYFKLPDMNGKFISIDDFKSAKLLVIVFTCNHCPTAQAYEDRLIEFTSNYKNKGVQVVAIMPNSSAGLLLEECGYSDLDDSFGNMALRARDKGFNFPYLYDGDDQAVSIQYGPSTTPHVFVFDKNRRLQYVGRIDGVEKPGTANSEDLRLAVDELLEEKPVSHPVTKAFGCSTKWSWKSEWALKMNKDWNEKAVELSRVDDQALKTLLTNNSEKLLMVNVWATWCAPCVMELPELINLQRMYGARSFEFITLSADQPSKYDDALKLLQTKHSALRNFIYTNEDRYQMIELIDPDWNGSLPYSMLIEPGGKVIYRNAGVVDLHELKKVIVNHPLIGKYF
ncbi:MAG: redoxin domain-containing protein [Prolixibacteraceae bacterium]